MKKHALIVGSPAFLRLWSVLGCEEKMVSESISAEDLLSWGRQSYAEVVLYEENILERFSSSQKALFLKSSAPCWIPLPSVEGKEM
jgi:hypothetical protein